MVEILALPTAPRTGFRIATRPLAESELQIGQTQKWWVEMFYPMAPAHSQFQYDELCFGRLSDSALQADRYAKALQKLVGYPRFSDHQHPITLIGDPSREGADA